MDKLKALVLPKAEQLLMVCPIDVQNKIKNSFNASFNETGRELTKEEQDAILSDAEVLLTTWGSPVLDIESLKKAPRLKYVGHAAGTVKHRVPYEAFGGGVRVFSGASRIAAAVADWCMAVIMTSLRMLPAYTEGIKTGWDAVIRGRELSGMDAGIQGRELSGIDAGIRGRELSGMDVGIVSLSSTARALIPLLKPFGCDIIAYDPYTSEDDARRLGVRPAPLEDVMSQTIVSLHLPQLPSTKGMITGELIKKIPDGGLLVNSSRGSVIDEQALINELKTGRISAALDVFEEEPLPLNSGLRSLPNCLITPHIAGNSRQCYNSLMDCVVSDILNAIDGKPTKYEVDPRRWEILA